jgi:hypothetical protein
MHSGEWIAAQISALQTAVSIGFDNVHRRMDDQRKEMLFHIRRLDSRSRKGNGGNGPRIPYAKIATLLGLVAVGSIGHMAPGALRAALIEVIPQVLHNFIGG